MTDLPYKEGQYGVCRNCNTEVQGAEKSTPCPECGTANFKVIRNIQGVSKLKGRGTIH